MTVLDGDPGALDAGLTPLRAARARADEAAAHRPLFTDPYSQMFVDADGSDGMPPSPWVTDYVAARTKWFDDFFLASSSAGVSQVVILGSGLDARAFRLPWLSDTVIYEVEQPELLDFKQRVLNQVGAEPAARHVLVGADVRDDWPRALIAAGFLPDQPTVWAVEGLLPRLPADQQEELLGRVDLYSARGSRIGMEADSGGPDHDCWLCARMWETNTTTTADLMQRYHRTLPAEADELTARSVFLDGRKL
ncbi:SAM-dependent methyltransferase [Mycobacterium sp. ITM-2016-00317]|uniref:SAM-dependent methyltransferase n=1 Tax=Mycobacterium sp. ITM-2016-00317 TaxID=2099694 RepID=UPI000D4F65BB|nr:SAM-dependent methyltransferase [Mycobacterium sp. ITM-2016-00317]WNG88277.1 SAM-dependent methyltransferase [Mycobacterium sp. ITM-2016-00317]